MRHRKIKRPMVPALVFTVAGVLIGLMHVPLPPVLLLAAALGGIWLLPMLSGRNESDKCNKHNYIRGCNYSLEKSYSYGQNYSYDKDYGYRKGCGDEKNRNCNGSLYIQLFLFSYYFWLVLSQHISMKIMTIKYLVKNYSVKSYLRRKKQNMAVV